MKRGNFLRSLLTLAVSPKVLTEIKLDEVKATPRKVSFDKVCVYGIMETSDNSKLFEDLSQSQSTYIKSIQERYNSENYKLLLEEIQK